MIKILYLGSRESRMPTEGLFISEIKKIGEFTMISNAENIPVEQRIQMIRECDVLLTVWGSMPIPVEVAKDPGNLKYVCNISGSVKRYIPLEIIDAGVLVTNWGDAPANGIAEGAMALLLAVIRDLHAMIMNVRKDGWKLDRKIYVSGTVKGLKIGIYGCGAIGRRFVELVRPFKPEIRIFDPYISEVPEGCIRVNSLKELFSQSQAIVIHAGLCEETEGTVTADLLAMLPEHGIVINTARGAIIDQDALFKELETGRLRAGLDVLAGNDHLPDGHPARVWENCIFTCHSISGGEWSRQPGTLSEYHEICLDNLSRYAHGEPIRFVMDRVRYLRST